MPTIEVIVSPQGATQVTTRGFAGTGCQAASQSLEAALGLRQAEQLTPEFYQQQATNLAQSQGQR
ncbi:hypothetical protein ETAA8_23210 [Anatilimnocola aggregata]|uniref:DUF2997 domain-containing protein n=1 Tax=Anatilimnocola aggregata TaxID=2528021 RepID=A0A517YAJ1_9BACT|nr:DUF2997 domain-containing protein [Anatilimnocola aggregata]QDU27234.1 hypothetical protein ETAA8_23210 [Anatilimnocola aggregata]